MTQETPTAAPAPLRTADDTPMMQQYLSLKRKHADAILFFRMGDFYEMFFEDAKEAAGILEIALTARNKNKGAPIPMCGVPHHSSRQYIAKLVKAGKTVAICEQMEDPRFAKGLVKRDVVRTITPGTVLDDALLDPKTHHFLAAVVQGRDSVGLAAVDLSTGLFQVCELPLDRGGTFLEDQLAKWDPQEILVPKAAESSPRSGSYFFQPRDDWTFGHQQARRTLLDHFRTQSLDGFGCEPLKNAVAAAGGLLHYLQETQKSALGHITRLSTLHAADTMFLDQATIASLELVRASDGQRAQSLLGHLDQSRTPMGARRIRDWILNALVAKTPAEARLHVVAELVDEPLLRREVRDELKGIMDLERLLARISLRLGSPRDVSALKQSLSRLPGLRERLESLESAACQPFLDRWDAMADLHAAIDAILVDDPPLAAKEGHLIKSGCDAELDRLKTVARNSGQAIAALEAKERERTLIPQLKVGYNKIYGYYLEATKKNLDRIPPDYIRKQSLVNAERFISPELKKLEEEITGAEEKIQQKEQALFQKLCAQVAGQGARLQSMARVIGEVDALAAFAEVAHRRQYTRPELTDDDTLLIKNGRHPLLEDMHGGVGFVPNDTRLDGGDHQVLIITGPNMAGKSTYLRQVALITIMAQMGSFVPADEVRLGLVDRIFSRVGAQDHLLKGQSTFMVEMNETANILHHATRRSLIILDEIGRGTSTFDGLSLAWAIVEHLHGPEGLGAKTLFATHYHELTELALLHAGVQNYNVQVKEWNDEIIFLHKIVPGGADQSYGIQVARLAGLPERVLRRAREVLNNLETNAFDPAGAPKIGLSENSAPGHEQFGLFQEMASPLGQAVKDLNPDQMTPKEALEKLYELVDMKKKLDS